MNRFAGLQAGFALGSNGNRSPRAIHSSLCNLLNPDFDRIGGQAYRVMWKAIEKCGLNIPNIAFLNAGLFFDIPCYSGFNCLHVRKVLSQI
jgi:hypothetical protein